MSDVQVSVAARVVGVNAILWLCNGGFLQIYTGKKPLTVELPAPGTLLVKAKLPSPAFTSAERNGEDVIAISRKIEDAEVLASGIAGWFRCVQKDGTGVWQGTCGIGSQYVMRFKPSSASDNPCELLGGMKFVFDAMTFTHPLEN